MTSEADFESPCGNVDPPRLQPQKPHQTLRETAFFRWRMPTARGIWLVALTAGLLISSLRVLAEDAHYPSAIHLTGVGQSLDTDLVLICPQGGATEPRFQNQQTGKVSPITDPRLRAIAEKACQSAGTGLTEGGSNVNIVNTTGGPIWLGFFAQAGASINWVSGCTTYAPQTVEIQNKATCQATVTFATNANPGSRFCAVKTTPGTQGLDCSMAQQNEQTLIEANFALNTGTSTPCYGQPEGTTCIYYDISLIPLANTSCQNNTWFGTNFPANCSPTATGGPQCAGAGKAAYNLPVALSCTGEPTLKCRGPTGLYPPVNYPKNCGMPNTRTTSASSQCVCGQIGCTPNTPPNCIEAFFYPMACGLPNPNPDCPNGQPLTITFLSGS
jgi:hypothetical protein